MEGLNIRKSKLEFYLDDEPKMKLDLELDLEFCSPELAHMARDILSIPMSTVASKASFSLVISWHILLWIMSIWRNLQWTFSRWG
uniref:HAT C-terminal dimerisation domain-containing protein n=1 Tax=Cannabis sativa TaxID=3483 RepID=A0A803R199_CANSA